MIDELFESFFEKNGKDGSVFPMTIGIKNKNTKRQRACMWSRGTEASKVVSG